MKYRECMVDFIATETETHPEQISLDEDFKNFNLDSLGIASMTFELEKLHGKDIPPTAFSDHSTISTK